VCVCVRVRVAPLLLCAVGMAQFHFAFWKAGVNVPLRLDQSPVGRSCRAEHGGCRPICFPPALLSFRPLGTD
jgi:hypothetical protein